MADSGQHLDMNALNELKQIMGDEFNLLVETFDSDSVDRIAAIKEAVSSADSEAIRRAAHSFKGSAGNMGATHLAELCRVLEELGNGGQVAGSDQLLDQISNEYGQVHNALAAL